MLYTSRLHLRKFKVKDIDELYKYRNNQECAKYQEWEDTSREYLTQFIEDNKLKQIEDDEIQLAIALKDTDELVGDVYIAKKGKTITLGFTTSPTYQRKGYMYEMLHELISYLWRIYSDYEICGLVHPENDASMRLMEKLGFHKEELIEEWNSQVYVRYNQ
ncbi:acetyltransferase [Anaeromicropila herbilytica]|uniref:Acetyltransferase n=2 Tax=Anaeromicropila herbilytica TaxID=2785025 RepID=A0A7R7EJW2_9FIRM|nr:acetyltransferase [Anaeromicropila herbilytica]